MNTKWLLFAVFVWIIGMIFGATFEKHTGDDWTGARDETTLEYLLDYKNITYSQSTFGDISFPMANAEYFSTLLRCMTFQFEFFEPYDSNGDGTKDANTWAQLVKWVIFVPFSIAIIFALIYSFVTLLQGFIPFT
jgi:hypothetical protein